MTVYVLHRYWDNPSNEGNDILGVYRQERDALSAMRADAAETRSYYSPDFWEEDMTWETDREIHLGNSNPYHATICCWEIIETEVT